MKARYKKPSIPKKELLKALKQLGYAEIGFKEENGVWTAYDADPTPEHILLGNLELEFKCRPFYGCENGKVYNIEKLEKELL